MDPLQLPFDQYQRYRIVQEAVEALRGGKRPLSVLDAGGNPGQIFDFLPGDRCVVLDRAENPGLKNYIRGDALTLPFPDSTFDITVSVDTLEHIPQHGRKGFVEELWRVTRGYLLIAAPLHDPNVELAERILYDITREKIGLDHDFLREHLEYGLPGKNDVASWIKDMGGEAAFVPNGYLSHWLPMMALSFYLMSDPVLRKLADGINSFYNRNFYPSDNREPCYRNLIAAGKNGLSEEALERIRGLEAPPGNARELDLSWVSFLVTLKGYGALKAEKKTLSKVISDKDSHIGDLKRVIGSRDIEIESLKKAIGNRDSQVESLKNRIRGLEEKMRSIEGQAAFKALKGLGIIKK